MSGGGGSLGGAELPRAPAPLSEPPLEAAAAKATGVPTPWPGPSGPSAEGDAGKGEKPETRSVCSNSSGEAGGLGAGPICKICFQGAEQVSVRRTTLEHWEAEGRAGGLLLLLMEAVSTTDSASGRRESPVEKRRYTNQGELLNPCRCDGSVRYTHQLCLLKWISERGSWTCELCCYRYHVIAIKMKRPCQWQSITISLVEKVQMIAVILGSLFLLASVTWLLWSAFSPYAVWQRKDLLFQICYGMYGFMDLVCIGLIIHEGASVCRVFKRWRAVNLHWDVLNYDKATDIEESNQGESSTARTLWLPLNALRSRSLVHPTQLTSPRFQCGYVLLHLFSRMRPQEDSSDDNSSGEVVMRHKKKSKHTGSKGATKSQHPKKDKTNRCHKKHPQVPRPDPSSLPPISVPTEPSIMQVTAPPSPLCILVSPYSSLEYPEPVTRASILDGEICESPPPSGPDQQTARLPTSTPGGQSSPKASPRMSHRCSSHCKFQADSPLLLIHTSPDGTSSLSPPYQSDLDSENSQQALTSSDAIISTQGPGLPSDSLGCFSELLVHMSSSLEINIQQHVNPNQDNTYDIVWKENVVSVPLPFILMLRQVMMESWQLLNHPHPTFWHLKSMYKVRDQDIPFLLKHPQLNSVMMESTQGRQSTEHSAPTDHEGRKIDMMSHQIYAAMGLGFHISNYEATMACYQYFLWQKIESLVAFLLDQQRELAHVFIEEAMQLSKQQLTTLGSSDSLCTINIFNTEVILGTNNCCSFNLFATDILWTDKNASRVVYFITSHLFDINTLPNTDTVLRTDIGTNNIPLAVAFDKPQCFHRDLTVLHIQHLQVKAVGRNDLQALSSDALARLQAQPFQVEAIQSQKLKADIRDHKVLHSVVRDALTAPCVEVAQLAAVLGDVTDPHISDAGTVGDAEVPQAGLQLGNLTHAEVTDKAAVAHTQLADGRAVNHQVSEALVSDADTAAQVEVRQLSAVGGNGVQSFILKDEAVTHVQVRTQRDHVEDCLIGDVVAARHLQLPQFWAALSDGVESSVREPPAATDNYCLQHEADVGGVLAKPPGQHLQGPVHMDSLARQANRPPEPRVPGEVIPAAAYAGTAAQLVGGQKGEDLDHGVVREPVDTGLLLLKPRGRPDEGSVGIQSCLTSQTEIRSRSRIWAPLPPRNTCRSHHATAENIAALRRAPGGS
ncbi:E3 ubiquitin-protein ligase MARCH11 [Varanus komodoensis]|nr:E3 ubiquitin-protein ligase MARCH11 [Varanus komodoensis]